MLQIKTVMTHLKNVLLQKLIRTNKNKFEWWFAEAIASIVNLNALNVKSNDTFMKLSGETYSIFSYKIFNGFVECLTVLFNPILALHIMNFSSCRNYWGGGGKTICLPPQSFHGGGGGGDCPPPKNDASAGLGFEPGTSAPLWKSVVLSTRPRQLLKVTPPLKRNIFKRLGGGGGGAEITAVNSTWSVFSAPIQNGRLWNRAVIHFEE